MLTRLRRWWATARSSVLVHRGMKWAWLVLWVGAEVTGSVADVRLVSRLSFIALILGSWSAEEAAKTEQRVEQEEAADVDR